MKNYYYAPCVALFLCLGAPYYFVHSSSIVLNLLVTSDTKMVHLHGIPAVVRFGTPTTLSTSTVLRGRRGLDEHIRPPDPHTLLSPLQLDQCIGQLYDWMSTKQSILAITGAGLSTESGIPDYRGHRGSYHPSSTGSANNKPMTHDQFMTSAENRKRYWGRGMLGWRSFDQRQPSAGHVALAALERHGKIGVSFDDSPKYYYHPPTNQDSSSVERYRLENALQQQGQKQHLSVITQNVDYLHQRAGTLHVTELHGRTSRLKCMHCGTYETREAFTKQLESLNSEWLIQQQDTLERSNEGGGRNMLPDGDAHVKTESFSDLIIPSCSHCGVGFLKPDVVFFGDSVPSHRVARCRAAVDSCDGLLCIGTSLAVYSAFRFVKMAVLDKGVEVCILNVGETRAEMEGLQGITKIEAPIGKTLTGLAEMTGAT
jgi:NAD+-dependent protein deacetylase sirtuin 4